MLVFVPDKVDCGMLEAASDDDSAAPLLTAEPD